MADQRFELAPGTLLYVVAPTGEMTALRVGAAGGEISGAGAIAAGRPAGADAARDRAAHLGHEPCSRHGRRGPADAPRIRPGLPRPPQTPQRPHAREGCRHAQAPGEGAEAGPGAVTVSPAALEQLRDDLGALVLRHEHAKSLTEFSRFADDLPGFADLLGVHLWSKQQETWQAVHDHRLVRVRSAQAVGKTYAAAVIIVWWLLTHVPSKVIAIAGTERQVRDQLFSEIRALYARVEELPGDVHVQGVEL